jgi:hypothetical protein
VLLILLQALKIAPARSLGVLSPISRLRNKKETGIKVRKNLLVPIARAAVVPALLTVYYDYKVVCVVKKEELIT